jgi:hypothetical protein
LDRFADDKRLLARLVQFPGETLRVELKAWLDPNQPADAALIVQACLALRNRNGGHLLIGFRDKVCNRTKGGSRRTSEVCFTLMSFRL